MMYHQQPHPPCCIANHAASLEWYFCVQHLIERCLLFHMTRDDCVKALAKHARIQPIITITVWEELMKENRGFFQAYHQAISPRHFNNRPNERVFNFRRRRL